MNRTPTALVKMVRRAPTQLDRQITHGNRLNVLAQTRHEQPQGTVHAEPLERPQGVVGHGALLRGYAGGPGHEVHESCQQHLPEVLATTRGVGVTPGNGWHGWSSPGRQS
jgi:hypothetical protein